MHEMSFIKVTDGTQLCRKQPTDRVPQGNARERRVQKM